MSTLQRMTAALANNVKQAGKIEQRIASQSKFFDVKRGYLKILYEVDSQSEVNRKGCIPHGHLMLLINSTTMANVALCRSHHFRIKET